MARTDSSAAGLQWAGVPMPPGLTMLPAEMALRPDVAPFLPSGDAPAARPRQTVRIRSGDTLRLEAGLVRRSLKGRTYTMYAFNGQYPGPLIEAVRGSELTVDLPQPAAAADHGALARPSARQPERRRARTSRSPRCRPAATSPTTFAFPTRASTGITRTSARTSSRSSASTATCWSGSDSGAPVRSGQSRGGAHARRPPGRRRRPGAARAGVAHPRASWAASATCCW